MSNTTKHKDNNNIITNIEDNKRIKLSDTTESSPSSSSSVFCSPSSMNLPTTTTTTTKITPSSSSSSSSVAKSSSVLKCEIELTKEELHLFDILLDVVAKSGCNSVLRAAGGWVRDKLRGEAIVGDLDIAVDNMFGKEFAEKVNEYLATHGDKLHRIGVIRSNPEQSKHLETATMNLFDRWLDFVNLRSESYSEDSRIPSQMGLKDLRLGIIRTPLPPLTTFLDDPLRVLRAVRFASRFNFLIDGEMFQAASDARVKEALRDKISKERIGKEVDGMLKGNRPDIAFNLISQMGLYDVVFALPPKYEVRSDHEMLSKRLIGKMVRFLDTQKPGDPLFIEPADKRISILASFMAPYGTHLYPGKKNKPTPVTSFIIGESLKLPHKDSADAVTILNFVSRLQAFVHLDSSKLSRKDVGLLLREVGGLWNITLGVALVSDMETHSVDYSNNLKSNLTVVQSDDHLKEKYNQFAKWIKDSGLEGVWDMKPLLNGGDMQQLFKKPAGNWIGPATARVIAWQIEHPSATKDECKEWLLN